MRQVFEAVVGAVAAVLAVVFFIWAGYSLVRDVKNAIIHRNDRVYVVSLAYDPVWYGKPPQSVLCHSPARCEPDGKPSFRYFAYLKEYEVREWGLDPSRMIPEP
jgi:hypothetical protein